ncbi:putative Ig domain-containing protein, partial [bacterium]|nr:putative Ig domain-containing protein [bacterium]
MCPAKSLKFAVLILLLTSLIIFSGCGGWNPTTPPIPPEPEPIEIIIPDTTKVVDEETIQEIISVSEDQSTVVFKSSTPQLEELAPGDIIAMGVTENTPKGLLRKVKNITKGAKDSSEVIVETEFATIEEAIEQGEFSFNEALKAEDAKEPVYYVKGVEFIRDKSTMKDSKIQILDFNYKIDTIIYDADNNPKTEEDNIVLTGQVSFDYDLLFSGKIAFPHQLKELNFQNICEIEKSLGVKVGGSAKLFKREKVLWTQSLGTKLVMIGPVPVVLSPEITIKATVEGEIFAELTAEVTDTNIYTVGIQYNNGSWQPISSHEYIPTTPSLSLSVGGDVTFGIGPILECEVDYVAGPYCGVILYAVVLADIYENPWWTIYGGILAQAGVKIEIFSKTIASADLTIFPNLQIIIAQADGPFYGTNHPPVIASLTANPSSININETTAITCTASDEDVDDTLTYTWTKNGGTFEGSTSGSTITWKAPSTKGSYTVTCAVSDGEASDSDQVIVSVGDVNHPPEINSDPVTSATKGQPYSYDVNATDPDVGDTLTYSFNAKPTGMNINSSTGLITWTPTATGSFGVTVKVSDGELFDTQSFTITVSEIPPILTNPTVITVKTTNITATSATLYGNITNTGGENCNERGFVLQDLTSGTVVGTIYTTGSYGTGE